MSSITLNPRRSRHQTSTISVSRGRTSFLLFCSLAIAIVSALDTWFAVANKRIIDFEKNPICLVLIELDPSGCSYFVVGKTLGTIAVLIALLCLHRFRYRHAFLVTIAVTLFQIGLMTFLTLSDPKFHNLPNISLLFVETPESIWKID